MLQPQSHTSSYYAATINHKLDCPTLLGAQSVDICIVGAGFTGLSTALHLAEKGYRVAILEANRVGWGASGRNGGQLIGGISGESRIQQSMGEERERLLWDLRWAGHKIIRDRVEKYQIDCDFKSGYVDVAIKPRHMRDLEAEFDYLDKNNFPFEYGLFSREETEGLLGTKAYLGSLLNMGNGHLHPLNLCIGEAKAVLSLGASIYECSSVVRIDRGKKVKVVTEHGSVTADAAVLAGNAYHFIEPKLRGTLFPVNSFIIASEPLENDIINQINPKDLAVCDPNYILTYFRLSADKRILFGGRFTYFGNDQDVIKRNLVPRLIKIYPQLAKIKFDYAWGGTIGVTVNRVPHMGKLAPNIFYSQGYSGHGVNVTHLAGQIVSEAVAGTMERFNIFANIKPVSIPGQHIFRNQMVSMGMLYYKLRDWL